MSTNTINLNSSSTPVASTQSAHTQPTSPPVAPNSPPETKLLQDSYVPPPIDPKVGAAGNDQFVNANGKRARADDSLVRKGGVRTKKLKVSNVPSMNRAATVLFMEASAKTQSMKAVANKEPSTGAQEESESSPGDTAPRGS